MDHQEPVEIEANVQRQSITWTPLPDHVPTMTCSTAMMPPADPPLPPTACAWSFQQPPDPPPVPSCWLPSDLDKSKVGEFVLWLLVGTGALAWVVLACAGFMHFVVGKR